MRILAALLLIALLAGCAGRPATGTAPTPVATPPTTPNQPTTTPVATTSPGGTGSPATQPAETKTGPCAPNKHQDPQLEVWGGFDGRRMVAPGGCQFVVDTGQITVVAHDVQAPDAAAAVRALQVKGAASLYPAEARPSGVHPDGYEVTLTLRGGAVGQAIEVTLTPVPGEKPLTASLERKANPTVTVSLQQPDGSWAPLPSATSLPPGPKKLRFQGSPGIYLGALKFSGHEWGSKVTPDQFTLVSDDLAEVVFDNPPSLVWAMLGYTLGTPEGLRVPDGTSFSFYVGDPPELRLVNPDTGAAQRLATAPPDLYTAPVRTDGRYAALVGMAPNSAAFSAVWLLDTKLHTITPTDFRFMDAGTPAFDARGRLIVPLEGSGLGVITPETGHSEVQSSAGTFWGPISPDGRYIAGRDGLPPGRGTGAWVGPPKAYHLVIRDLMHDTEKVFPWDGYAPLGGVAWLPDGRLLQATTQSAQGPDGTNQAEITPKLFLVDLKTGQRTPYAGQWPALGRAGGDPPSDKPDERWLGRLPNGRSLVLHWANLPNARPWMGP